MTTEPLSFTTLPIQCSAPCSTETFPASADDAPIPNSLRELVNAELADGETIRWTEQPAPALFSDETVVVFLWGLVILFIMNFVWSVGDQFREDVYGNLLVASAWALVSWLVENGRARHTVYIVTNVRAIIAYVIPMHPRRLHTTSYYLSELSYLFREQKRKGKGNLYFRAESWFSIPRLSPGYYRQGFLNIRNVREVDRLIQELKGTKER